MNENIVFERKLTEEELTKSLRNITFRGLYNEKGDKIKPYENAKFSLIKIYPPMHPTDFPQIMHDTKAYPLFTAQPTVYKTITKIMIEVDNFLQTIGKRIFNLDFEGIQYNWEGRGRFHVLPPIIEKHSYPLTEGSFDLKKISEGFSGTYVKDAIGKLHEVSQTTLKDFYIDRESKINYLDVYNSNAKLINYGLKFNGNNDFYLICDGSHRMDYSLEILNEPTTAILVESEKLYPYYAFPMPWRPTTRLTSKEAEKMYPRLERDKVHLFNNFIKKVLHYNWETGDLHVSKLRSKPKIF